MEFSLEQLLPQPFWLGPPLPRFLAIFWPWVRQEQADLSFPPMFSPLERTVPEVIYQNTEELQVIRDASGGIERVIRTIKVTKNE